MPKYNVTLEETILYTVVVEAGDKKSACEAACDLWAQSDDPTKEFDGSGNGVEAIECERAGGEPHDSGAA